MKEHIQAVSHATEQCRFRRGRRHAVMVIDHYADASQIKPKLVFNIPAQPLVRSLPLGRRSVAVLCAESRVIPS